MITKHANGEQFLGDIITNRYERVYLPLFKVADTPFHIQGDKICDDLRRHTTRSLRDFAMPS